MERNTKFCDGGTVFRGRGRGRGRNFIKESTVGSNSNDNSQGSSWDTPQNKNCLQDNWTNYENDKNRYNQENGRENFGGSWSASEYDYKRAECSNNEFGNDKNYYCNEQNYAVENNDECNYVCNRVEDQQYSLGNTNFSDWNDAESNYNIESQAGNDKRGEGGYNQVEDQQYGLSNTNFTDWNDAVSDYNIENQAGNDKRGEGGYNQVEDQQYGLGNTNFSDWNDAESDYNIESQAGNNKRGEGGYNQVEDQQYGLSNTNFSDWNDAVSDYNTENQAGNDKRGEGGRRRRESDKNNDEGKELPKKVEFYIPPELGNEESEVFSSGITTGINFEKFDNIKVEMNGDNLPNVISSFEDINLKDILMNNIRKSNYIKPTPIQRYALSTVMAERDLMACAQTGSGKTAAFLLPIINYILENPTHLIVDAEHVEPQAIIISPTRELAIQTYQEARKFSFDTNIKVSLVYGGASTGHQRRSIDRGCDIMIATPGRLLDFVKRGWVTFSSIRFVVLDEADRMLSMGFLPSMQEIFEHPTMVPTGERRTLMFSATFPQEVQNLAAQFLQDYVFVTVGIIGSASSDVEQVFLQVGQFEKRSKLLEILNNHGTPGTLIFVETKRNADFLAIYLSEQHFKINSIHGDRSQREREEAIRDFKIGKCDILVATSVAARGLDIQNVRHVINFDLPVSEIEEYIHRIGRTGRIGNKGMATSFYDKDTNSRNAETYARILEQAEQTVPDWLRSDCERKDYNRSKPSFGGRDIRRNRQPSQQKEEEMW